MNRQKYSKKRSRIFNLIQKICFFSLFFLMIIFLFFLFNSGLTGKTTLSIEDSYSSGESISDSLRLILQPGEFIPADTKVIINNEEFILRNLIKEASKQGEFYISDADISGFGEGYGSENPEVFFTMNILSEEKEIIEEATAESEIPGAAIFNFFSKIFLTITGKTSLENINEIQGKVSKDKPFVYALEQGQTAEIKNSYPEEGHKGHKDKKVNLEIINNTATITTDYSGEETEYLINLSELNIPVSQKDLEIKLIYNDVELASINENLNFEIGSNKIDENETIFFSTEIKDSKNKKISAIVEFEDSETDKIKAVGKSEDYENLSVQKGKYNIKVKPQNHPVKEIIFENLEIDENVSDFIEIDDTPEFENFVEVYAINPGNFNFTNATVIATAKGNVLMKCKDWNFSSQICLGEWEKIKKIIPGQDYHFTLTPEDPGFGETNVTNPPDSAIACDFQSCPKNVTEKVSLDDNFFAMIKVNPNSATAYINMGWNNSISLNSVIDSVQFKIEHKVAEGPDAILRWWNGSDFVQAANLTEPTTFTIENVNLISQINTPEKANNLLLQYYITGTGQGIVDWADLNITFTEIVENFPPTNPAPIINSTDGSNKTKQNLNCFSTISDPNPGDKLNVTVKWFKNSTEQFAIDYNNSFSSGTFFSAFLDSGNTTKGEVWKCAMRLFDGEFFSNFTNSSELAILNTLPAATLVSPADGNITTNRTPTFFWNATDDDNDFLTYELNISCYPGCSSDNRLIANLNETNHTLENILQFLSDNNFYYNWTVRANDGEVFGSFAKERKIFIQSLLTISLINDSVNFGQLTNNESINTTSGSSSPVIIQNDGNSFLNISVNVTSLFDSAPSPTENYQLKIGNSTEHGTFDWFNSLINWFNAPITTTMAIVNLNSLDEKDTAKIDLRVRVPEDETAGNKSSTIIFTSTLAE